MGNVLGEGTPMSTRSVAEKLLIRPNTTLWSSHSSCLELLPTGVRQVDGPEQARTALIFADDAASLRELVATHQEQLARPEVPWVAYPKGNPTDVAVGQAEAQVPVDRDEMTSGGNRKPAKRAAHRPCTVSVPTRSICPPNGTANLRYVGPVLEQPAWANAWIPPWPPEDQRPLVVVSMSTTYMRQERALRRCVDAIAAMPVRALVSVGPTLDPAAFHGGQNVVVVGSAPHDQMFPHASAVVTHAGMGTVMRALAHGLPLLWMPQGRDQHDVTARVRWHGAGLRLGPRASAAKIQAALHRLLRQPSFREAAARLRQAIQAPNANAVAERWVGTVRQECLDHLLIAGRRQLVRVLHGYVEHYNRHRPHRGLGLSAPEPSERCEQADASAAARHLHRRDVLGGLIHEYERAA